MIPGNPLQGPVWQSQANAGVGYSSTHRRFGGTMPQPRLIHTEALESRALLSASISGTAYRDANLDGVRQSSETGLAGEIVYVDANNNGKFDAGERSATSNASGAYTF